MYKHDPFGPGYQQEPTMTVKQHNDAILQHNKDLLLIVSLGAVAILLWALRKRRGGGWE